MGEVEDKKFSKQFVLTFAMHCMIRLVSKPPTYEGGYNEISADDWYRVNEIIRKFKS